MRAELAAAGLIVVSAVAGVRYWEANRQPETPQTAATATPTLAPAQRLAAAPSSTYAGYEEVRIPASQDHQFYVTASINNAPFSFLVDTGAGYVVLRDSDARKAGIYTVWTDFTQPVRTANGETRAAAVDLRFIEIGGVRVENVKAFILADDQLGVNLLGMTFLSRLHSVETRAGEMILRG